MRTSVCGEGKNSRVVFLLPLSRIESRVLWNICPLLSSSSPFHLEMKRGFRINYSSCRIQKLTWGEDGGFLLRTLQLADRGLHDAPRPDGDARIDQATRVEHAVLRGNPVGRGRHNGRHKRRRAVQLFPLKIRFSWVMRFTLSSRLSSSKKKTFSLSFILVAFFARGREKLPELFSRNLSASRWAISHIICSPIYRSLFLYVASLSALQRKEERTSFLPLFEQKRELDEKSFPQVGFCGTHLWRRFRTEKRKKDFWALTWARSRSWKGPMW